MSIISSIVSSLIGWTWTMVKTTLVLIPIGAIGSLLALYSFQNQIIYPAAFPPGSRQRVDDPSSVGFAENEWEEVWIDVENEKTQMFLIYAPGRQKDAGYLVYFHANAGNMGHRLPIARILHSILKCNIVMFSYRGYGVSPGSPCEKGMTKDAETIVDWTLEKVRGEKVVFFGQSIGGAVAIKTASIPKYHSKISGLILENTFLSLPKLVPHVMPIIANLGLVGMVHDQWTSCDSILKIPIDVPICFLSGLSDELVPPSHMAELYALARNRTNESGISARIEETWTFGFRDGMHNDTVGQDGFFERIKLFWDTMILKMQPEPAADAIRILDNETNGQESHQEGSKDD
jgi:fermentation-respiration switch protein FrsA (DUF1100 family)